MRKRQENAIPKFVSSQNQDTGRIIQYRRLSKRIQKLLWLHKISFYSLLICFSKNSDISLTESVKVAQQSALWPVMQWFYAVRVLGNTLIKKIKKISISMCALYLGGCIVSQLVL